MRKFTGTSQSSRCHSQTRVISVSCSQTTNLQTKPGQQRRYCWAASAGRENKNVYYKHSQIDTVFSEGGNSCCGQGSPTELSTIDNNHWCISWCDLYVQCLSVLCEEQHSSHVILQLQGYKAEESTSVLLSSKAVHSLIMLSRGSHGVKKVQCDPLFFCSRLKENVFYLMRRTER